uniref:Uncharacterized protein n=1 Tax=Sphaerodactylus townsendi TaxID=933632 RepID=A0ACB8EU55_9SAUR
MSFIKRFPSCSSIYLNRNVIDRLGHHSGQEKCPVYLKEQTQSLNFCIGCHWTFCIALFLPQYICFSYPRATARTERGAQASGQSAVLRGRAPMGNLASIPALEIPST